MAKFKGRKTRNLMSKGNRMHKACRDHMITFIGSKTEPIPDAIFTTWNYIEKHIVKDRINNTIETINSAEKIIYKNEKNIEFTPYNCTINISNYLDMNMENSLFRVELIHDDNTEEDLKRQQIDVKINGHLRKIYTLAKDLRKENPDSWQGRNYILPDSYNWQEEIKKLCQKYEIDYSFTIEGVYLKTKIGTWKIKESDILNPENGIRLYHKNLKSTAPHSRVFRHELGAMINYNK